MFSKALLEKLTPEMSGLTQELPLGVKFLRIWAFDPNTAVIDYLLDNIRLAFDIIHIEPEASISIEMLCRGNEPFVLASLGREKIAHNRVRLSKHSDAESGGDLLRRIVSDCRRALHDVAGLTHLTIDRQFSSILQLEHPPVICDVGANPVDEPPYANMLALRLCKVVGFEPQPEAYENLRHRNPENELYFPRAVGKAGTQYLNIYQASGFTSTFEIDDATLAFIGNERWKQLATLKRVEQIRCITLDDMPDLPDFDMLKIDIQGGELSVFETGKAKLSKAVCEKTEVSIFPLNKGAPNLGDQHRELMQQGFLLHKFMNPKSLHVHSTHSSSEWITGNRSQLIDGDAVYIRDLRAIAEWPSNRIKSLAALAHFVFDSKDIVLRCLDVLSSRKVLPADAGMKCAKLYRG